MAMSRSFQTRGSSDDKSLRTAGMKAKTDPVLIVDRLPLFPRVIRTLERTFRR